MSFEPTAEQLAIIDAAKKTKDNLIIHALAGAAKTSTLVLIAKALSGIPMTCLAFNSKIAAEMRQRLPGNCEAMTLNSIGHRTWARALGKNLVLDDDKVYRLTQFAIERTEGKDRTAAYEQMSFIMNSIKQGQSAGWVPEQITSGKSLLTDDEFFTALDEEPSLLAQEIIETVTVESINEALHGIICFNDQITMPTLFFGTFMARPLTMTDESQDFSLLNHVMISKIVRDKRLIAVGDENQSIYGFRGAHANSMDLLRQTFQMRRLDLTVSFRCPISVVKEARQRAPAMRWPVWAIEGTVSRLGKWNAESLPHDAVILCRQNAPLFNIAVRLLRAGRYPQLVGNDIVKALIKIMSKLGDANMKREDAFAEVDAWLAAKEMKARDKEKCHDQALCMKVFIEQGETLGDAIAYAEHVMKATGPIKLMTGHRSKGLEFPHIFILDKHLINTDRTQDNNLLYVMVTRAQETLTYIRSEDFE